MHVALQVFQTSQLLERAARGVFARHGLSLAQFNVLNLLAPEPNGLRGADLAAALLVDPSNVTGLVKRMGKCGLIREARSPHDRRERVISLTPEGRELWKKAHRDYEAALAVVSAELSGREQRAMQASLHKMMVAAQAVTT